MNVVEFLKARLDEDEEAATDARLATEANDPFSAEWLWGHTYNGFGGLINRAGTRTYVQITPESKHINRQSPERVLREVKVKRELIRIACHVNWMDSVSLVGDDILKELAAAYSDHADYQSAWGD